MREVLSSRFLSTCAVARSFIAVTPPQLRPVGADRSIVLSTPCKVWTARPSVVRASEGSQRLDERGVDLIGPLLLDPVARALDDERAPEIGKCVREARENHVHPREAQDGVLAAGYEHRRLGDLRAGIG